MPGGMILLTLSASFDTQNISFPYNLQHGSEIIHNHFYVSWLSLLEYKYGKNRFTFSLWTYYFYNKISKLGNLIK